MDLEIFALHQQFLRNCFFFFICELTMSIVMLRYVIKYNIMSRYVMLCYVMLCSNAVCFVMLSNDRILGHVMLRYVM